MSASACECMTERNPMDPSGAEVVLTHSSGCSLHPDYDEPVVPAWWGETCETCGVRHVGTCVVSPGEKP